MAASQVTTRNPSAFGEFLPVSAADGFFPADARDLLGACLGTAERAIDAIVIFAGVFCAYALYRRLGWGAQAQYPASPVVLPAAGFALLFVILLERHGGYRPYVGLLAVRETERILRVTVESFLLALLAAYFSGALIPRLAVLLAAVTVPVVVILAKWETRHALHFLRARGYGARRAVIVGAGTPGRRIFSALARSPRFGLEPVAFVDDDPQLQGVEIYESSYQRKRAARVIPGPICPAMLRELDAAALVIARPDVGRELMVTMAAAGADIYCLREDFAEPGFWIDHADFDGLTLAHFSRGQVRVAGDLAKRVIDVAVSAVLLAACAAPLALLGVLVKLTSPGPVFFRQYRVGKDGRRFSICKFRTMYQDAPRYSCSPGAGDDLRVTPLGRFLRRTSLDEFPQLLNVLLGDMSLVGPRPEMPFIVAQYTPLQHRRLSVKPGITGLWQLSADRAFPIHENIEYDLYYLTNNPQFLWSIALQLAGLRRFDVKPG